MARLAETTQQPRFTLEEYHRMAETGILAPGERVELVRGVVREMSPKGRAHVVLSTKLRSKPVSPHPSAESFP